MKSIALGAIFFLYPGIVYFGLQWFEPSVLALVLVIFALLRQRFSSKKIPLPFLNIVTINILLLLGFSVLANSSFSLKLYPVVMNLSFLSIFIYSLFNRPAAITIIASLRETLSEKAVAYTVNVTMVWCVFFLFNGSVAMWTVYQSEEIWLFYNGFLSYVLTALLFLIEWLVRRNVKKNDQPDNIT